MNLSAGVIESLFGKYKSCKADNPLYSVTPLVLSLCVHTHWEDDKKVRKQDIQNALQSVSMANLSAWKGKYLIENQAFSPKKTSDKPTQRLATRLKRVRISYSLSVIGQLVIGQAVSKPITNNQLTSNQ